MKTEIRNINIYIFEIRARSNNGNYIFQIPVTLLCQNIDVLPMKAPSIFMKPVAEEEN